MKTHEIDTNVHAASSAAGRAPAVKPPRSEVPLPGTSAGEPATGPGDPVQGPSLVVPRSPDPPGIEVEKPVDSRRQS
jgi:hypothetical protein